MVKRSIPLIFLTLLLISCASTVPQDEFDAVQDQISALEADLEKRKNRVSELEDMFEEKDVALSDLQQEFDELEADHEESKEKIKELTTELRMLNKEMELYVCQNQIDNMKYENILDASTILSAWVANQDWSLRVQGTYRDTIWSNALTKIHAVRYIASDDNQSYVDHFVVYFDEFGFEEGTFWVSGQCWLDR